MNNPFPEIVNNTELKFFSALALILVALLGGSIFLENKADTRAAEKKVAVEQKIFPDVELKAKAAYVYDARTGEVLYAKNENERLALASLTKLMSALVAYEKAPSYGTVTVTDEALKAEGDSGLLKGEKWSLRDLLDYSLVMSSNDGMRAVALSLGAINKSEASSDEIMKDFVGAMNDKAEELNLKNTYYFNETGLDEDDYKNGAYGSAKDMATLFNYILTKHPEMLEKTREKDFSATSLDKKIHYVPNTNQMVDLIPGLLGSKTGFTDLAGGNLVIGFDPEIGRPIIVAVLGSTETERFEDVAKLVVATMSYISQ